MSDMKPITSADICRDHALCERNAKSFRGPQECGLCERHPAVHFLNGASDIASSFALRCDACLLSGQGCPHVTGAAGVMPSGKPVTAICAECYDWVSLEIEFPTDKEEAAPLSEQRAISAESVAAGVVDELIEWSAVEWTQANAAAFFQRTPCDDEDCEHCHSHFEEQRAIALGNLHSLQTGDGDADQAGEDLESIEEVLRTIFAATEAFITKPIPMILNCPECGAQHIDVDDASGAWATSRHHRKHLCSNCGHIWMPAEVHTVGVKELQEVTP